MSYVVTTLNWNDPAFWASVSETVAGQTLDFSALPETYFVAFDGDTNLLTLSDGTTPFTVGDADDASGDAQLGGTTQWGYFTNLSATGGNDVANGTAGDDVFDGGGGADTLSGDDGSDTLSGGSGEDILHGGTGEDSLSGGADNDKIYGGADNDSLYGGAGNDTLAGGTGADTLYSGDGIDRLIGDDGDDTLYGVGDRATFFGGNGSDSLFGGDGDDRMDSGADDDVAYGGIGNDELSGGAGNDLLDGGAGNDALAGWAGDDTLFGGDGADRFTINPSDGNDTIYGGESEGHGDRISFHTNVDGVDVVMTGDESGTITGTDINVTFSEIEALHLTHGNDTYDGSASSAPSTIQLQWGDDTAYGGSGNDNITGQGGDDVIYGGAGNDTLGGDDGNDTLYSGEGIDRLDGGEGDDTLYGAGERATLIGGNGADSLFGSDGNDSLYGGGGDDVGYGGLGNDRIDGHAGNDVLYGGEGNDSISGWAGDDTLFGGDGADSLIINLNDGNDTLVGGESEGHEDLIGFHKDVDGVNVVMTGDESGTITGTNINATFSEIEMLRLSQGNDIYDGSASSGPIRVRLQQGDDTAYGGSGDDSITGELGNDVIYGGAGNDLLRSDNGLLNTLYGGDDADYLAIEMGNGEVLAYGGEGGLDMDTLDVYGGEGIAVTLTGDEAGTLVAGDTTVHFEGIEGYNLHYYDDMFDGSVATQSLMVESLSGNDTIFGGQAGDTIIQLEGDSTLHGNGGDDIIMAGAGNDTVFGGDGADTVSFLINEGDNTVYGGDSAGDTDVLDLSGIADGVTVVMDTETSGTATAEGLTVSFSGIEEIRLSEGTSTIDRSALASDLTDTLDGGNDTFIGGSGHETIFGGEGEDNIAGGAGADDLSGEGANDTLAGGADNDTLSGGDGADTLLGEDGDDKLYGNIGEDHLEGGSGNDTLAGNAGDDLVYGGDGADTLMIHQSDGNDTLFGGESEGHNDLIGFASEVDGVNVVMSGDESGTITGADINVTFSEIEALRLSLGNDVYDGSASSGPSNIQLQMGDDTAYGGSGDDSISGELGNDTIAAGAGNDTVFGGDGADTISFLINEGDNTVYGGDSAGDTDVLDLSGIADGVTVVMDTETSGTATAEGLTVSFSGIEEIRLSEGTSTIDRSALASDLTDTLDGGNDTFIGGSGIETIYGGEGEDDISGGAGADKLNGGDGNDVLRGGVDGDTLRGDAGNDTLLGEEGNDNLGGGFGDDELFGGDGQDTLRGEANNDSLYGGDGNDWLYGQDGDDALFGGAGNDYFEGLSGNDALYGGDDRDTFRFFNGQGDNTVVGGEGGNDYDQLSLVSVSDDVNIVLTGNEAGTATSTNMSIEFSEIEDIRFGNGSDTYDASVRTTNINESFGAGNDTVYGGSGNDNLKGEAGNDELTGGAGNDVLNGGGGDDLMYGGDDRDVFQLSAGGGDDTIYGGEGGDDVDKMETHSVAGGVNVTLTANETGTVTGDGLTVAFEGIEAYRFGGGNDIFDGSASTQALNLNLSGGDNTAFGGSGNDTIYAGGGNNVFFGGAGDDILNGNAGDDTLYGGDGRDKFFDRIGNNTVYGGEGGDDSDDYLTLYGGSNIVVTLADDESGVATGDGVTTVFYGIEKINLSESSDVFDATLDTTDRAMSLLRGDDTAYGGSGNDLYVGNDGNDEIHGNAGNDTLRGDAGDDTLFGGDGADILAVGSGDGSDTIFGGDGGLDHDTLDLSATVGDVLGNVNVNVTLTGDEAGTAEVSTVDEGTVDEGTVEAGGATVQFEGIEGYILGSLDDSFDGSVATQSLMVESLSGNDTIFGGQAGDTIIQLEGDSTLHGNGGDDTIAAGAGNDTVFGGDGADTISFLINEGDNTVYGGDSAGDTDVLDLSGIADGVTVVMDTETSGTATAEGLTVSFSGIEEIRLSEGTSTIDRSALATDATTDLEGGNDTIFGGSGADSIRGGAGDDVLHGNAGNDSIWGQAGQDTLYGGDGNDAFDLRGGEDDNTVFGGEGGSDIDTLLFIHSADAVTVTMTGDEAGTATTTGTTVTFAEIEQTKLSNHDDSFDGAVMTSGTTVEGRAGDDTLTLGSGDDRLQGDDGNDTLDGGAGNDHILGHTGDDVLYGDEGNDALEGGSGNDLIYGGEGDDSLQAWTGNDTLYGGEGSDVIGFRNDHGDNTVFGGEGGADVDQLNLSGVGGGVSVTMTGDEAGTATGDGVTVTFEEIERFKLTVRDDTFDGAAKTTGHTLNGLDGDDTLTLGSGNDRLEGWNGNDTLDGGGGNDGIWGQAGNDTIYGNTGDDGIYAGGGDDIAYGGEGNDRLFGEAGNDTLYGGDGDDEFGVRDGYGDQTIFGGDGGSNSDYINFFGMTTNTTVTLTSDGVGTATGLDGTTVAFEGIERFYMGQGDDVFDASATSAAVSGLSGSGGNDTILGGSGNDSFGGGSGNDVVQGNGGDDSLTGGSGDDTVYGGDGADTITFLENGGTNTVYGGDSAGDTDVLDLSGIADGVTIVMDTETSGTATAEGLTVSFSGIEEIRLAEGTSTIDLSALATDATTDLEGGNDTFIGGSGNDDVTGGEGDDDLAGNAGSDKLFGGAGNDALSGGAGNDTIEVGTGDDTVYGGDDSDIIKLSDNQGDNTVFCGEGGLDVDTLSSWETSGINVTFTGDEAGTLSAEGTTVTFSEIETVLATTSDDVYDASARTSNSSVSLSGGDDMAHGGSGNDVLKGEAGNDEIHGNAGNDGLYGGLGDDTLYGGDGVDYLYVETGGGNDTLVGGEGGNDLDGLTFTGTTSGINLTFASEEAGTATADGMNVTFSEIERVFVNSGSNEDVIDASVTTSDRVYTSLGGGNDTFFGGSGKDTVNAGGEDDVLFGGSGDDNLSGNDGNDELTGGAGNDVLTGGTGDDLMYGGDDRDFFGLYNGDGHDTIYGGEGGDDVDQLAVQNVAGGVNITLTGDEAGSLTGDGLTVAFEGIEDYRFGNGNDTFDATVKTTNINESFGAGDDTVYAGSGDDYLQGEAGNDALTGGAGNDAIKGGTGDDLMYGGDDSDVFLLYAGDGNDTIYGGEGGDDVDQLAVQHVAGGVNITLTGDEAGSLTGDGLTVAFEGIEDYRFGNGNDTFDATVKTTNINESFGAGDDTVYGGSGDDKLSGNDGNDELTGGAGNDVLTGGAGDDLMYGGDDRDVFGLYNGDGNDTIYGGEGGDDVDQLAVQNVAGGVNITLAGDEAGSLTGDGLTVAFEGIEDYRFGAGNDIFDGSASSQALNLSLSDGDDIATGGSGNDVLYGGGGNDVLTGGAGDDLLNGFAGDDTLYGGDGIDKFGDNSGNNTVYGGEGGDDTGDYLSFYGGTNNVVTLADDESGVAIGDSATTFFYGIEILNLSESNDVFDATLDTTDRAMSLLGGDDTAYGGSGNDTYVGNAGNDEIHGNAGNDLLVGGEGDDTLFGGDGADTITFLENDGTNTVYGGDSAGDTDVLDLSGIADGVTVVMDTETSGTATAEGLTVSFSGIEEILLAEGTSTIDRSALATDATTDLDGGNDTFIGGSGHETIYGGEGEDDISGGSGNDALSGNDGNDALTGGAGSDAITGGAGDDLMYGGDDSDVFGLYDGDGNDTIYGGDGGEDEDLLDFAGVTTDLSVTLTKDEGGTATTDGTNITFEGIEQVSLGAGNDVFDASASNAPVTGGYGNAGNDSLAGGSGDDSLYGGADDDGLDGNAGHDTLYGGAGADSLSGGHGDDTLYGGDNADVFSVRSGDGADTVFGGESDDDVDTLDLTAVTDGVDLVMSDNESGMVTGAGMSVDFSGIEAFDLTAGDDSFDGSAMTEGAVLTMKTGDDSFLGGSGDDSVFGGLGDDTLSGGIGADTISGDVGNDTIFISEGDSVDGAAGDDIFVLEDLGEDGTGDITVRGGVSEETTGDVLKLGFAADWSTLTITDDDVLTGKSGTVLLDDGSLLSFSEIETIICFTPGTRITTPMGQRPVEELRPGDLVLTRDHGLQPVRWTGKRTVPGRGKLAPIRLKQGLIAGQQADLIVSPQHRVLIQGYRAQMYFGASEVLVAAKHLLTHDQACREDCEEVTYVHILFDQHEVILAEGAPTESFHPGELGLDGIDDTAREELFSIFPELRTNPNGFGKAARQSLRSFEAQLLLA